MRNKYNKIVILFLSFTSCVCLWAQSPQDTLKVGINDEKIDFLLEKDSLFEKEIVFEDSGRKYIIRVYGVPKTRKFSKFTVNPVPAKNPVPVKTERKKIRNLFADASLGITMPAGVQNNIVTNTTGFSLTADRVYMSQFTNQKFRPGPDLRLNVYQISRKLNERWWYKRSVQFNYYYFSASSSVYSSEHTIKNDGNNNVIADSLVFFTSSETDIRYHKFRLLFPYTFEKTITLNNGKQLAVSMGAAFSMNLVTNREIRKGYVLWGYNNNFSLGGALLNALVPMAAIRYHRIAWYGQFKFNPVSNINLQSNPQHWLFQSGLTFNLY